MRQELKKGNNGSISSVLLDELKKNIDKGEQSILFINRRGTSSLIICGECGYTYTCPNCSVSLTYHAANRRLMCHQCGYSQPVADKCPECGGILKFTGAGTQKVEEELHELLPDTEIIRMDTDTVTAKNSHETILNKFRDKKIPILLGTQMVTKGLNFENVTLVGVISADQYLYVNDYRAHERTFSMITQVVGRSGRGEKPGRAVIQTFTPGNEVIRLASCQDYDGFYEREIELRRLMGCPPVGDIVRITASGQRESTVLRCCTAIRDALKGYFIGTEVQVIGPAPASVAKVNNRYRYNVTLNGRNDRRLRDVVSTVVCEFSNNKDFRGVSVFADSDPMD
jgi:primosomal protein N' (replication factor Y)